MKPQICLLPTETLVVCTTNDIRLLELLLCALPWAELCVTMSMLPDEVTSKIMNPTITKTILTCYDTTREPIVYAERILAAYAANEKFSATPLNGEALADFFSRSNSWVSYAGKYSSAHAEAMRSELSRVKEEFRLYTYDHTTKGILKRKVVTI